MQFETIVNGIPLHFYTEPSLFSPRALDKGTLAMLSLAAFREGDKVLDLGCGYGPVGIYAAKCIGEKQIHMADADPLAAQTARRNAAENGVPGARTFVSDGFAAIDECDYTLILSNPPYHTDFSVAKQFIEGSFDHLAMGGRLYMVTKRRDWYKNKLIAVFGGVTIAEVDGYHVFTAEKRSARFAGKKRKA